MTKRSLAGCKALCVEDESLVAMLIEDLLESCGCDVVGPFAKLEPALDAISSLELDIAVLDVNLRGQRSYVLADLLDQRGVPFVFLTGYGELGIEAAYRHHAVVQKPFSDAQVLAAIEGVLREARTRV